MGVGQSIVSELNVDSLKINHPTPCTIVQPMTGGDALWYVIYRLLMASYMVGTFVYGVIYAKMYRKYETLSGMHFPAWSYSAATIQSVLLAYSTLENYYSAYKTMSENAAKHKDKKIRRSSIKSQRRQKKKVTFSVSLPKMPKIYVVIWILYYIMLYGSLITLIMYETGLFRGRIYNSVPTTVIITPLQIILHQVFFAYCILDFFVCGIPVRLLHAYVMTAFATTYHVVLLVVTVVLKWSIKKSYLPIYDVADIDKSRMIICTLYYVGFSLITPVAVHIVYYDLFLLKSYLLELFSRTSRAITQPKQTDTDDMASSDEKGAAGAPEWSPGVPRSSKIMPISEQEEAEISSINKDKNPSNNSIALVDFK